MNDAYLVLCPPLHTLKAQLNLGVIFERKSDENCLKTSRLLEMSVHFVPNLCLRVCVCVCVYVHAEGPAEPAERGHLVSEGESAGGAAAVQAAVG